MLSLCNVSLGLEKKGLTIKLINIYYVRKENIWHSAVNVIQISVTGKTQSAVRDIFSSLTLVCIYEACCQIKLSTLNTFIDATVKYSTTYHWATFHINPGKLFWQEVTDHYISKLFSHFYSTLFFFCFVSTSHTFKNDSRNRKYSQIVKNRTKPVPHAASFFFQVRNVLQIWISLPCHEYVFGNPLGISCLKLQWEFTLKLKKKKTREGEWE